VDSSTEFLEHSRRWSLRSRLTGLGRWWGAKGQYIQGIRVCIRTYGMNLGRMLVRIKVNEWKSEKVANGMMETGCQPSFKPHEY
jgi:GT2 family glycosyltransferase